MGSLFEMEDAGELFINQLWWIKKDIEDLEKMSKNFQRNGEFESLADNIDQKMDNMRHQYQQLEHFFDKLCEVSEYQSKFK